ncbi:hypothetical protein ACFL3S_00955 [Gemmatimonadota bacterium]
MTHRVKVLVDKVNEAVDRCLAGTIDPRQQLFLNGYWRSGTTWLQQSTAALLHAKTVFEPLRPDQPAAAPYYTSLSQDLKPAPLLELTMPFGEEVLDPGSAAFSFFEATLTGRSPGRWVRHLRGTASESFRRKVVVKVVRGSLALGAVQKTFRVPVLHVRRHPHAVFASIKRIRWPSFLADMQKFTLGDQLLSPNDGRRGFFDVYREPIATFDRVLDKDQLMIAYWALLETYVDDYARRTEYPFALLEYEKLLEGKEDYLSRKLEEVGISDIDHAAARTAVLRDSRTTSSTRQGISDEGRRWSWKEELTSGDIKRVDWILNMVTESGSNR